jgi:hypothetical protein
MLDNFDRNSLMIGNAIDLVLSVKLGINTQKKLANAIRNIADDYTFLNIIANDKFTNKR